MHDRRAFADPPASVDDRADMPGHRPARATDALDEFFVVAGEKLTALLREFDQTRRGRTKPS